MLEKTHTPESQWHIIRSDDKHKAHIEAMKLILTVLCTHESESQIIYKSR